MPLRYSIMETILPGLVCIWPVLVCLAAPSTHKPDVPSSPGLLVCQQGRIQACIQNIEATFKAYNDDAITTEERRNLLKPKCR